MLNSKKRWLEAGFSKYFAAKQAFGTLMQSAVSSGVPKCTLLPPATHEYLGWLLSGHPLWPQWAQQYAVQGYAFDYHTLTSAQAEISQLCLGFVAGDGSFVPFSGFEALHGELRPLEDRVRIAYAKEIKLLLSERVITGAYVEHPIDYHHLDRLINEFGIDIGSSLDDGFCTNSGYFAQQFPYHIVNRDYAASWRDFVRQASTQWGNKK